MRATTTNLRKRVLKLEIGDDEGRLLDGVSSLYEKEIEELHERDMALMDYSKQITGRRVEAIVEWDSAHRHGDEVAETESWARVKAVQAELNENNALRNEIHEEMQLLVEAHYRDARRILREKKIARQNP